MKDELALGIDNYELKCGKGEVGKVRIDFFDESFSRIIETEII